MPVVIQEVTAEVPQGAPRAPQPQDASASPANPDGLTLERLRAATLRDAQRQARLWAD